MYLYIVLDTTPRARAFSVNLILYSTFTHFQFPLLISASLRVVIDISLPANTEGEEATPPARPHPLPPKRIVDENQWGVWFFCAAFRVPSPTAAECCHSVARRRRRLAASPPLPLRRLAAFAAFAAFAA